jgi:hypothetical protein
MRGLFGGTWVGDGAESIEEVAPEVARAMADAPRLEAAALEVDGATLVAFDAKGEHHVRYALDLEGAAPLSSLDGRGPEALAALAKLAALVAALHARGEVHGELTGDAVRVGQGGAVALLRCARRLPPGALLAARLRAGASSAIVAYAAPEVALGRTPTVASDVYGLAALVFEAVTSSAPLGQLDLSGARSGPLAALAAVVERALAAAPEARPSASALAASLAEASRPGAHAPADGAAARSQPGASAPGGGDAAPRPMPPMTPEVRARAEGMSGILAVLLALGGVCVLVGALWLVTVTWSALGSGGRLALLALLTAGVAGVGSGLERRGFSRSGRAITLVALELVWVCGGYALDLADLSSSGAWALFSAVMTALAFGLSGARDSLVFALAAGLHFPVFEAVFGAWLRTGSRVGPALFAFALAGLAAGLAAIGARWRGPKLGLPFAAHAALAASGSALYAAGLALDDETRVFGTAWTYLLLALGVAAAVRLAAPWSALASLAVALVLAVAPSVMAVPPDQPRAYLFLAVLVGLVGVAAALAWPPLGRDRARQGGLVTAAVAAAMGGPTGLFLLRGLDRDGLDLLASPDAILLVMLVVASAALVGVSLALGKRAPHKALHRLVELGALGPLFGAFTIASAERDKDLFYPGLVLVLGVAALALGARTRRAALVVLAAGALLVELTIEYFARLWDVFPASVLVLVFGLALLAGGVVYERTLKRLVPELKSWD